MNNIEKLAIDELEEIAKTHPRSALTIAYSEGLITGINRAKAYAQQQTEPIGYVSKQTLDNLQSKEWKELRGNPESIWTTNNPPSRANIALYTHPPATAPKSAYDGAREDLLIWKKRALEAEEKVRVYDQRIVDIGVIAMNPITRPPATVPEGYALVPIEPTNEMLVKAREATGVGANAAHHVYKAMLSASPTPPNAPKQENTLRAINIPKKLHNDTKELVIGFCEALAEKLYKAEHKYGYSNGWMQTNWLDECRHKLVEHLAKGDPRDVAAYCAFLWHHKSHTTPPNTVPLEEHNKRIAELEEAFTIVKKQHMCALNSVIEARATNKTLLDSIRNALYQDLNDIKPYLRKLIAEAEAEGVDG